MRIAVGPGGNAWVVNKQDYVYRHDGKRWRRLPGRAKDIGVGANGQMWVIGTNREGGGFGVYKWLGSKYQKVAGSGLNISVDAAGNPWLVNNAKAIYKHDGKRWLRRPGAAYDIGVGAEGTVWVIGANREGGGFGIYRSSEGPNVTLWASQTQGAMNWRRGVRWVVRQRAKGFVIKQ